MKFKDKLRELRGTNTQKEIAQSLGVKQSDYQSWENGQEPNYETLIKIADFYRMTIDDLVRPTNCNLKQDRDIYLQAGLTEKAIQTLQEFKGTDTMVELNIFLSRYRTNPNFVEGIINVGSRLWCLPLHKLVLLFKVINAFDPFDA